MSKSDIIKQISKTTGIDASTTALVIDSFLSKIVEVVKSEGKLNLKELGKFSVKTREARKARNPRTGETIDVPAKNVVTFSASQSFSDNIK